jgi:hypothetical protein
VSVIDVHLDQKIKNEKPLNRAQKILRKNRKSFPAWYWRIIEEHSSDTFVFSWHIRNVIVSETPNGIEITLPSSLKEQRDAPFKNRPA